MNKQGFAVTGILYTLLLIAVVSMNLLLYNLLNRKNMLDQIKTDTVNAVERDSDFEYLIEEINKIKASISIDKIYPIGSIYITTSNGNPSSIFEGTTWERYGVGKTLVSTDTTSGETGGSSNAVLSIANLPGHSHTVISNGTVSSTFTGSAVNSGSTGSGYSIGYTSASRTTSKNGNHNHRNEDGNGFVGGGSGGINAGIWVQSEYYRANLSTNYSGNHTHTVSDYYANSISGIQAHTHSVTASGTVSSKFTGSSTATSTVGNGEAFSVRDPYITVYMWKRIS